MQDLFQLNFISYFAACKFALPHLRKVGGNIINMSSLTGVFGQAQAPTYTATKGAITSFSKGYADTFLRAYIYIHTFILFIETRAHG